MATTTLPVHPIARLFPPMTGDEFHDLVEDIRANGQREPITLYRGAVIDGVHRVLACAMLGRDPLTREWDGEESGLVSYVVSMNLHRRHLNAGQRGMIADQIANRLPSRPDQRWEGATQKHVAPPVTIGQASAMLGVGKATVDQARVVRKHGSPELVAAVEHGEVPIYKAARVARRYRKEEQMGKAREPRSAPKPAEGVSRALFRKRNKAPVAQRIEEAVSTLETVSDVLVESSAEVERNRFQRTWATRLREVRTTLSRFISTCEGGSS